MEGTATSSGHTVLAEADGTAYRSLRQRPVTRAERYALGKSLRKRVPRKSLGDWTAPSDRPDPVELINISHQGRVDRLIPIRVGRMFNAVGGSSIYYGAEWPRLVPSDFRVKTVDGVADDWPISYNDLKPYHDEVDAFIGVSGVDGDPAYPDGLTYPLPPNPLGKAGVKAAEAANALGRHWWPGTNAIPSQKFKTLEQCAR